MTLLLKPAQAAAALFHVKRNGQVRGSRRTPNLPVGDYPDIGGTGRPKPGPDHRTRREATPAGQGRRASAATP